MKPNMLVGLALLASAFTLSAQNTNTSIWITPPGIHDYSDAANIDAVNFVNPSGATFEFGGFDAYTTSDTLNYTNTGAIFAQPGFDFETFPPTFGRATMADNFVNMASGLNGGVINCTSGFFGATVNTTAGSIFLGALVGASECVVWSSNIVNSGTINMDSSSLMKFTGYNVDMSYGTLAMANQSTTNFTALTNGVILSIFGAGKGWLDGYWGVGKADPKFSLVGQASMLFPQDLLNGLTDVYEVVNRNWIQQFNELFLQFPTAYVQDSGIIGSNRWVEAVFLQNTNPAFANSVYFPGAAAGFGPPFEIGVQWQWLATNLAAGTVTTNYILLTDDFGEVTNIGLTIDGQIFPQSPNPEPTYIPENYQFFPGISAADSGFGTAASPTTPTLDQLGGGVNGRFSYTNQYAAYEAIFTSANSLPTDTAGGNVTNLAGRIEITAQNVLSLTNTTINALNYLLLNSTNHFAGSPGAAITSPNSDFYLRTTNGLLLFTNLVQPYIPVPSGPCELWSARYTNVDVNGITNSFHILFVDSEFSPITIPFVQTLNLTVTNFTGGPNQLFISDIVNVTSNLQITCPAITITTNGPRATATAGQLNIFNPNILWPTAFPVLQYLTNYGQISNGSSIFFSQTLTESPYNSYLTEIPYQAFVNHGSVLDDGTVLWSVYVENGGIINAGSGSLSIQGAFNSVLTNGSFIAEGPVTIDSASLLVSNHTIHCGAALTLSNSYYLDDGSYSTASALNVTNKNFWTVAGGINLPVLPTYSSLLGTTVTNYSLNQSFNTWAGNDLGPTVSGFANNAALGHLILNGIGSGSSFVFTPPGGGGAHALYVDLLELNGSTTNLDGQGNALNVQIQPGMTIYYGRALLNGTEFSEKLSGRYGTGDFGTPANSGQFVWVTNYSCGFFSSTNLFYPAQAHTNQVNAALYSYCSGQSAGSLPAGDCSGGLPTIYNICPPTPPPFVPATPPQVAPGATTPTISVAADAAQLVAPATVNLSANVAANGHSVAKVLFFHNNEDGSASLVGTRTEAPFSCTWSNVSAGSYSPTAVLIYDEGSAVVAAPVNLTITKSAPAVSISTGLVPPPADTNIAAGFTFMPRVYHGLFYDTTNGVSPASSGYFVANTTSRGVVTARISLGGHNYSFSGKFDNTTGQASGTTSQGGLKVQLQLTSDNLQILGTISGNNWSASLQADEQTSRGANTFAGNYTMVIASTNGLLGYGFGTVTVDAAGNLKWSGDLADGTKVTQSSAVSEQGFWPLFAPLSGGGGEIISWMQFASNGLSGDVVWSKPAGASGKTKAGPFAVETTAAGELYNKKVPAFDMAVFSGGGLSEPLTNFFTLGANHRARNITGSSDKLTLGVTASSGLFGGSILNPGGPGHLTFSGAVWSPTNAVGFFLNNGQSGSVTLQMQP